VKNIHVSHIKAYIQGLQNGAKLIVADPRFLQLRLKPISGFRSNRVPITAYMLAIMNYLVQNNKYDKAFVEDHTDGFEEFAAAIKEWTLEKAAKECDIPAEQIKKLPICSQQMHQMSLSTQVDTSPGTVTISSGNVHLHV